MRNTTSFWQRSRRLFNSISVTLLTSFSARSVFLSDTVAGTVVVITKREAFTINYLTFKMNGDIINLS